MGDTSIQWTDKSWNPVTGCTKVSAGCRNCYAERVFPRAYSRTCRICGLTVDECNCDYFKQREFTDVMCHRDRVEQPLHWRKPSLVFVNSMSDLFHEDVPYEFIDTVFETMALTPGHTYQILTKRHERMAEYIRSGRNLTDIFGKWAVTGTGQNVWPLPNVWLGVSVEDQESADKRIPTLVHVQAAVRFISYEPALGPINFAAIPSAGCYLHGFPDNISWLIFGGESGHGARETKLEWARNTMKTCDSAGCRFFMKQTGHKPTEHGRPYRLTLDLSHGADPRDWPHDLRVRNYPRERLKQ